MAMLTAVMISPFFFCSAQLTRHQAQLIEKAVPEKAGVAPKQKRRVLIWNTPFMEKSPHKGYSIPQAEYAMKLLGTETGAYEPLVSDDVAMYLPENLKTFDAIIFNNSNGQWIRPTEDDLERFDGYPQDCDKLEALLKKSFLEWLAAGGGVVAYHHAISGNPRWPEFGRILGAGYSGHPWHQEVRVRLEEPAHPLLAPFNGNDFSITEEIFQFREPYSRKHVRVLMKLDAKKTDMSVPWINRTDDDFALSWIRRHEKGRIFYGAFGHRSEIWWNPLILRFYLGGIQYALGDLEADDTPSAFINTEPGFVRIFNGNDLTGWRGNPRIWTVQDGVLTGQTTPQNRVSENTFLIWTGGEVEDFELRLKYRIEGGNSGIYFRSRERTFAHPEPVIGTQADFSADQRWTGVLMEYTRRGIIAERGQKVVTANGGKINVTGKTGDPAKLLEKVDGNGWNDYTVIARGEHIVLKINGVVMCEVHDRDPWRIRSGILALQVHRGPDMKVRFKEIRIREF